MASKTNKQGLTLVEGAKFVATAQKLGLKITKQAGNYRIEAEGNPSKRLYVPTTKRVHRVDLSGFTHELAVEIPEEQRPTGKVTHWLDFSQDEKLVLRAFYKIARTLVAVEPKAEEPAPVEQPVEQAPVEQVG